MKPENQASTISSGYDSNLTASQNKTQHSLEEDNKIHSLFNVSSKMPSIQLKIYRCKKAAKCDTLLREITLNKIGPTDEPDVGISKRGF